MNNLQQITIQNKAKHAHEAYMRAEYHKAIKMFEEILDDNSVDADQNYQLKSLLGLSYLAIGELEKGWRYWIFRYQARKIIPVMSKICTLPFWHGDKLGDKNLLLLNEDGIGDELYYSAVFDFLPQYAKNIYIVCDERIKSLYERTYPEFIFTKKDDWPEIRRYGRMCSAYGLIGDVPRYLDPQLKSPRDRKLIVDPVKAEEIRKKLAEFGNNKKFIGVSYKTGGNKPHITNKINVIWDQLGKLKGENVIFINLQENNLTNAAKKGDFYDNSAIKHINDIDLWNDFDAIAALIDCMDAVVTIDNYIAHLSGRLLKKTDLLIPKFCNVRWYYGDPGKYRWYPTINIYEKDNYEIENRKTDNKKIEIEENEM